MDRSQRLADELEIRNLLAQLIWHADNTAIDDLDGYLACFTDDAVWEMRGDSRDGHAGVDRRSGLAEILAGARERRLTGRMGPGTHIAHFLSCTLVTFDEVDCDRAEAKSYIQAYRDINTNPTLFLMGQYHDTFRRTPAGWKMQRRVVQLG